MAKDTLSITDNRTGKTYEVPVENDTIRATDLRQIKVDSDDFGLMSYDPAFTNTASCRSSVTYIDGDKGILRYRGYPIQELAEESTFLEVAYLLIKGELPTQSELEQWKTQVTMAYSHCSSPKTTPSQNCWSLTRALRSSHSPGQRE